MWGPLEELETWDLTCVGGTQGALEAQGAGGQGPILGEQEPVKRPASWTLLPSRQREPAPLTAGTRLGDRTCTPYPPRQPLTSGLCRSGRPWGVS